MGSFLMRSLMLWKQQGMTKDEVDELTNHLVYFTPVLLE
jgi:hypothetical protein